MIELNRTVRFALARTGRPTHDPVAGRAAANGYSAFPAVRGLGRYYELKVACRGEADPVTGYFINIKEIDAAVREHVLPYLQGLIEGDTPEAELPLGEVMRQAAARLQPPLWDTVASIELALSPKVRLGLETHAMDHVTLRQQYEFSAAHRLHADALSDHENQEVFGKCNNPAGHGHNYRLEVAVAKPIDAAGHALAVDALDSLVDEHVLDRLDHKNLNGDVPEFADLNPSVEHITQVIWGLLAPAVAAMDRDRPARLDEICVWETEKTACVYRGPAGFEHGPSDATPEHAATSESA